MRVALAPDGTLASVWDKRAAREVLAGRGNQLWAYVDKPRHGMPGTWTPATPRRGPSCARGRPRWSRPARTAPRCASSARSATAASCRRCACGPGRRGSISPPGSTGTTAAGWSRRASRSPSAPSARPSRPPSACVERPTHRNTSWDDARFEVAGHRFADLSEPGYGAALLNDGRYGHHALGSELGLSLLRSPTWPDPLADEGVQEVTYALYPHAGRWLEGGVLAEAEDLNRPLLAARSRGGGDACCGRSRSTACRSGSGALKALEDGGGLVLRAYEPQGARGTAGARRCPTAGGEPAADLLERPAASRSSASARSRCGPGGCAARAAPERSAAQGAAALKPSSPP